MEWSNDEERESDSVIIWTSDDPEYMLSENELSPQTTITEAELKAVFHLYP